MKQGFRCKPIFLGDESSGFSKLFLKTLSASEQLDAFPGSGVISSLNIIWTASPCCGLAREEPHSKPTNGTLVVLRLWRFQFPIFSRLFKENPFSLDVGSSVCKAYGDKQLCACRHYWIKPWLHFPNIIFLHASSCQRATDVTCLDYFLSPPGRRLRKVLFLNSRPHNGAMLCGLWQRKGTWRWNAVSSC